MGQENLEIALIKYNKKTWCKSAILGFFIGLAVIVPGERFYRGNYFKTVRSVFVRAGERI